MPHVVNSHVSVLKFSPGWNEPNVVPFGDGFWLRVCQVIGQCCIFWWFYCSIGPGL